MGAKREEAWMRLHKRSRQEAKREIDEEMRKDHAIGRPIGWCKHTRNVCGGKRRVNRLSRIGAARQLAMDECLARCDCRQCLDDRAIEVSGVRLVDLRREVHLQAGIYFDIRFDFQLSMFLDWLVEQWGLDLRS